MKTSTRVVCLLCVLAWPGAESLAGGEHGKSFNIPGFLSGPKQFRFVEVGVASTGVAAGPATASLIPVVGAPGAIPSMPKIPHHGEGHGMGRNFIPDLPRIPKSHPAVEPNEASAGMGLPASSEQASGLLIGEMRSAGAPEMASSKQTSRRLPTCD